MVSMPMKAIGPELLALSIHYTLSRMGRRGSVKCAHSQLTPALALFHIAKAARNKSS